MRQRQIAALVAEALGTFVLVVVVLNVTRYGLPLFTALAAGLTVAAFTSAVGKVSGGHFNPAITLGFLSLRKISFVRAIAYLVVQVAGAVAAWQLYQYLTGRTLTNATTAFEWKIFIAEAIGALVFGFAFASVVSQKVEGWQAAATIGTGLFLGLTVAGLGSAAILNPAVAVGVRSFDVNYFLGPIIGAVIGMYLHTYAVAGASFRRVKLASSSPTFATKSASAKKAVAKKQPAKKNTKK
jgi:glycerol uptake facilitator-like aquaporin